jgi:hypothetical protein
MLQKDRRIAERYVLHYDFLIQKGVMLDNHGYLARVVDASVSGMRLFLAGVPPLPVGAELQLECVPARYFNNGDVWTPVKLDCLIVWRDLQQYSYGLSFA